MPFPDEYTTFSFINDCAGRDLEAELDDHEDRISILEDPGTWKSGAGAVWKVFV